MTSEANLSAARKPLLRLRTSRVGLLIVPVIAILLVAGLERTFGGGSAPTQQVPIGQMPKIGYGPASFAAAMARSDQFVAIADERVRSGNGGWLWAESMAQARITRFRLTGNYDDLAAAGTALAAGRADAPERSGPLMSEAAWAMMTHRLDRTAERLAMFERAAIPPDSLDETEVAGMRGDIAFYRGDMATAAREYTAGEALSGAQGMAFHRAVMAKARGDFDAAILQFRRSAETKKGTAPFGAATMAMQIGGVELARGNHAVANRWFHAADRTFPGFWLIEAHLAQARAIDGDLPGAIDAMRGVAMRSGSAEAMDALAMLLRAQGIGGESRLWAARADVLWRKRLSQLPEAAYGHALEHELVFGTPEHALDLATRNLAARPNGESRLMMASALLMNGRTAPALEQLALAERSGWRSGPLYALRAQAFELSGKTSDAEVARRQAQTLNPHIFEPVTTLVWFSHG